MTGPPVSVITGGMPYREPTAAERDADYDRQEARELARVRKMANHARAILADVDDALAKAADAATYMDARTHVKGPASTFALAVVRLLELL